VSTHSREVVSGADGTFSIDGLASGKFQLEASTTTRYGRVERAIEVGIGERAEGVVVQVYPARSIVATIDVLGDPKVCQPKPSLSDWHFTVQPPWRDEAGRYHFDGVPPGFYAVTVGCGATVAPITVADTDVEVTWRIETGGVVKGKIVDAARRSKQPLFAVVELGRAGSLRPPLAMTAIDDEFELRGVPAGTYTLVAKPGRGGKTKPQTVEVANGATVVRDLVVEPRERGRVVGTVVDKTSRVGTATIQLSSMGMLERETVTARAGRFEVELPAGAYRVHGSANGRASTGEAISVTAGETTTVQIELDHAVARREDPFPPRAQPRPPELYQLAGRVVDPNGAPVEGAIVDGMNASYWGEHAAPRARALTKADGSFALQSRYTRLEVDVYRIGGGHTRASLEHGESNQIELRAKTTISGTVLRADGSPAPRFEVRIGEGAAGRTLNFDYTGGRFAIEDNVELPLVLSALVNGVAGTPVTIAAGAAKTGIVLRLPPAVTITGRVVDGATRAPIANVRIDGRQDRDGWAPWFTHADQVTDADGRFTIRDLPPGKLMLELTPPFDTWSVQTMNITVPDARADIGELGLAQVGRR
jgi:protocatechuate 3,4-dioxygenase beta subunit